LRKKPLGGIATGVYLLWFRYKVPAYLIKGSWWPGRKSPQLQRPLTWDPDTRALPIWWFGLAVEVARASDPTSQMRDVGHPAPGAMDGAPGMGGIPLPLKSIK
jgi:hypothetical protein